MFTLDMDTLKVGVIGLQGDVEEHISALGSAFTEYGVRGKASWVRREHDLASVDGLVIPGGESTTISKLLVKFDLRERVISMAGEGAPILGTCAGCVLLASEGDELVKRTGTELLSLMDMAVDRNAFGPQRESFEAPVAIEGLGEYPGVFIRAPLIRRVWGKCRVIGKIGRDNVLAVQRNILAASFHPELTGDSRFYKLFLDLF